MRGTIDMIVLEKCSADFFILDDSKYLKLDKSEQSMIFRFMEYLDKKRISVKIITIDELASLLLNKLKEDNISNNFDLIANIGMGGKELFAPMKEYFVEKEVKDIICKRVWYSKTLVKIEDDINSYYFQGKKVLLIDDVVATGHTLNNIIKKIENLNGIVSMIMIGLGSCNFLDKENYPIIIGKKLYEKHKHILSNIDGAYWYPGIYSIRHLLNEENGMANFKERIAEMYFENDAEVIKILSRTW